MSNDPKIYGFIIEFKCEQPIIMEGCPVTHEEAYQRMRIVAQRPDVIRVAIFKAIYSDGNEGLIEKESEAV